MTMPNRSRLILPLMVGIAACGDDISTLGDVPVQVEDSAGVRIVRYEETPTADPAFRLAAEPRYRHGADPGDYAFQEASIGRLLPDGGAVVYDAWNAELVVFSHDGASFDVVATEGEGPGDVQYVSAVFALGQDSILAADPNLGRVTLLVGGEVVRTTGIRHTGSLRVRGMGPSGVLLLATSHSPFRFEEEWFPGHMARLDMETGALDTVASYDFVPRIPPELEWDPIAATGEVTVAAGHFVYTRADRAEVTWRQSDGTVAQIVRWHAEPALLTEERLEPIEAEHRMSVRMHSPGASNDQIAAITRTNIAAYEASLGRPLPRFGSPFADAEGRVWLPSYKPGGELNSVPPYTVMGPDGEWLGMVEAPARFRILDVAGGLVLGAEKDEMDVESLVVYELVGG